jgi:hypothetical protein
MRAGKRWTGSAARSTSEKPAADGGFGSRDVLLKYYEKQADEFRLRHAAIWEEIRHYTWLLSLLLSWPVAVLSAKNISQLWKYAPYFIYLPVLGLCISVIAFFVIRREFMYYNESDAKLLYIEKMLGLTSRDEFLDQRLKKANSPGFSVDEYVRVASHIGTYAPWKARIRALFLLEIIIFGITAVAEITFCVTAFFRMLRLRAMIARATCSFRHDRTRPRADTWHRRPVSRPR